MPKSATVQRRPPSPPTTRAPSRDPRAPRARRPVPPGVQIQFRQAAGQAQTITAGQVHLLLPQGEGAALEPRPALAVAGEKQIQGQIAIATAHLGILARLGLPVQAQGPRLRPRLTQWLGQLDRQPLEAGTQAEIGLEGADTRGRSRVGNPDIQVPGDLALQLAPEGVGQPLRQGLGGRRARQLQLGQLGLGLARPDTVQGRAQGRAQGLGLEAGGRHPVLVETQDPPQIRQDQVRPREGQAGRARPGQGPRQAHPLLGVIMAEGNVHLQIDIHQARRR